jgi:hypothetical protein
LAASSLELWSVIADEAAVESPLWAEALRSDPEHDLVFSPLGDERWALGLETIYEAYLLHYGRPRLFAPRDQHTALLLGDYLYAHGLVRIAEHGDVGVVAELAALISVCAQLRADGSPGDGEAWAATAGRLRTGPPADAAEVERALAAHAARVG